MLLMHAFCVQLDFALIIILLIIFK